MSLARTEDETHPLRLPEDTKLIHRDDAAAKLMQAIFAPSVKRGRIGATRI
jgi:hypothetical protein